MTRIPRWTPEARAQMTAMQRVEATERYWAERLAHPVARLRLTPFLLTVLGPELLSCLVCGLAFVAHELVRVVIIQGGKRRSVHLDCQLTREGGAASRV